MKITWIFSIIFVALSATARAQVRSWVESSKEIAHLAEALPRPSRDIVERMGLLQELPKGPWHYHAADLAHGESTDLNDSDWPIDTGDHDYSAASMWFRRWVVVPQSLHGYDMTGARIWFSFKGGRATEIVYLNGKRVAMGEDLEPILVFDGAKPGEKALIAVKLLTAASQQRFSEVSLSVEPASNRPNPKDLLDEFLSATVLIPSLSPKPAGDMATLERAIDEVDLQALDGDDQKKFDASLRLAQSDLEPLRPILQQSTFHETGNSHIDAAWLWPWTETVDVVRRTFSTALQLMDEYPTYTYTQSTAQFNEWMADKYPEINNEIKRRIKQGRWEIVGGMWVEPDLNMPDGESTVRSIMLGKRWYAKNYGVDVNIGWNPDSFGYTWQLPQIYKKTGIDYFVTQKMAWNDTNQLPLKLFWWESPDGSKVLTYFPHGYANTALSPVRLSVDLRQAREDVPGTLEIMDLYGVGDHGGGPTRSMLDNGLHWMEPDKVTPKMQFGAAATFFADVSKRIAPESQEWNYRTIAGGYHAPSAPPMAEVAIPTWKDELYLETHRGGYTSQAAQKRNIRESSESALNAEKYASLAWLEGDAYPGDQINDTWKKITFNNFHDLAAGSGIATIYRDAERDYAEVRLITGQVSRDGLQTIADHADTRVGAGVPVLVFNPLGWERSDVADLTVQMPASTAVVSVLDSQGHVLPSEVIHRDFDGRRFHLLILAKDVPSVGYAMISVVPGQRAFVSDLRISGTTMENGALRVAVDPKTGCITSLFDKRGQFETLAPRSCGNELQAYADDPKKSDAWNIAAGALDQAPAKLTMADSVRVVEDNPMRGVIRITRTWHSSRFVQDIILYTGSDEVKVVNDVDWQETHVLLKAAFQLSASSPFATYEIPFGTIERPTTRNNSWEKAKFEVPALRWADLGDGERGFSLINDSKYGYDAVGNVLRLTLLRSPVYPDPTADRGHQHFSFALYPHTGDWKQSMTVQRGYDFNYRLAAMQVEPHMGANPKRFSFISVEPSNVVLTAVKKAEDSDALILHMYEWSGKASMAAIVVPSGATSAVEANLMEKPEGSSLPIRNDQIRIPIHPFEILAVKVNYSNRGQTQTSVSVE